MIKPLGAVLLTLTLAASCATPPPPRQSARGPLVPAAKADLEALVPTPSWPARVADTAPPSPAADAVVPTGLPSLPGPLLVPVVAEPVFSEPAAAPGVVEVPSVALVLPPPLDLPLPAIRTLPLKAAPGSRSWTPFTEAKKETAALPVPTASVKPTKAETAPEAKALVPAKPAAAAPAKAASPPTPASTATLLPIDQPSAGDFQWQDVNAVAGDAVSLHFEKTNWLYLDPPAQQKVLGYLSATRDKEATNFLFRPSTPGVYTLEFQRQDLVNQSTEVRKVKLTVAKAGTKTSAAAPVTAPQTALTPAGDAVEASRALAASGKTAEAIQKLLQAYKADDARMNLEMARLLNQGGQSDEALGYLDKNLTLTGPDFLGTLELGTKLAASREPQKKLPAYVKLWTAGTLAPSEDLYLQVMETLRAQKMAALLKDWTGRYQGWYPAPQLKDRYLYQLGQWLEEPGEARDIRASWKAYTEVVQAYPLSVYWKAAGERAAYLNRHFLQVR